MFDVLVYLFETYYTNEAAPEHDVLTRQLSQAGFETDEISEALDWLHTLAREEDEERVVAPALEQSRGVRNFTRSETAKLSRDARGFLVFLESAGVLSPALREVIIEHALALDAEPVPLAHFKVIVLMVLWTQRGRLDSLVLEELLPDGRPRQVH
jgi:Smg protein